MPRNVLGYPLSAILSVFEETGDMARKRLQKTGYLFEEDGCWRLQYRVDEEDGTRKRRQRTIAFSKGPQGVSKREAGRIARDQYLAILDQFTLRPGSMMKLSEFVKLHYVPSHFLTLKPKGKEHVDNMLRNHILPALGGKALREITTAHVLDLMTAELKKNSVQTAKHVRNTISNVFRLAKLRGLYSGDLPTEGVRLPAPNPKQRGALKWEQVEALVAKIPEVVNLDDPRNTLETVRKYQTLIRLMALTGMRVNEALALTWADVDLTAGLIQVTSSVSRPAMRFRNATIGTPKSTASYRTIPVPMWMIWQISSVSRAYSLVFASRNGTPLDSHNLLPRVFKPAAKLAGLSEAVSFHWLRHTASTLQEQAGMTAAERQSVLGHASEKMTQHYTHADLDIVRAKMEKIAPKSARFWQPTDGLIRQVV